jgi:hypothetical protein
VQPWWVNSYTVNHKQKRGSGEERKRRARGSSPIKDFQGLGR